MCSGDFLSGHIVYGIILRGNVKNLADNSEDKIKEDTILKQLNYNVFNNLILTQDDIVCSHIFEYLSTKDSPNGINLHAWERLNKKFQPITGASKTKLSKKFEKNELDGVTRDPEDCITDLEWLIWDLQKLGVIVDDVEMMTHILSSLPEEYEIVVENLEEKLDDDIDTLTIEIIWITISTKYDIMNAHSNQK